MNILVGKVLKAQGIKGELKIACYLDNGELLSGVSNLLIANRRYKLLSLRNSGGFSYIKLEGVEDRNAAELLKDWEVYADKDDIALPSDSYFVEDVIGCNVYDERGNFVGRVTEIEQYGAADVYNLVDEQGRQLSFPWLKKLEVSVDVFNKKIVVNADILAEVAVYQDEN